MTSWFGFVFLAASQTRNQGELMWIVDLFTVDLHSFKLFPLTPFFALVLNQRKLAQRSERVKSVDLHPTEPW